MQKLILDTNVIISALISNSVPTKILYKLALTSKVKTCLSDLELAAVSSADYLITGNTLDFPIAEFEYTKILTPREYWDYFAPKKFRHG